MAFTLHGPLTRAACARASCLQFARVACARTLRGELARAVFCSIYCLRELLARAACASTRTSIRLARVQVAQSQVAPGACARFLCEGTSQYTNFNQIMIYYYIVCIYTRLCLCKAKGVDRRNLVARDLREACASLGTWSVIVHCGTV